MSMMTTIDKKVVEMQFQTGEFAKNVKDSIKMLDLLKKSLDFSKSTKGLDNVSSGLNDISHSVKKVDFSGIKNGLESIEDIAKKSILWKFFSNIADEAWNAGKKIVKGLTVEQPAAGWEKYGKIIESTQTIMSATSKTWEESAKKIGFTGTQMEFVSEQLEKLNWFADETSYSLTDMTNNIGKFTSTGVELQDAVVAMEGISVWAAKSGQKTTEASRAMYNLAQAMSVGSVKVKDWMSIENANMATMEFKQTAMDAAVALKTLKKSKDGVYSDAKGKVTVENFRETLQDDWFTSEVLMKTLNEYGKAATYLSDISDKYGVTATGLPHNLSEYNDGSKTLKDISSELEISLDTLTPMFETLNSEEYKLSLSAFRAAQETKTFSEAIEATKDAVSTGWMKSFEFIFGNYDEAKEFWTEFTERLWDIFAASGEVRNRILDIWKNDNGREQFIQSLWNIWDALDNIKSIGTNALGYVFGKKTVDNYIYGLELLTKKFKYFSENLLSFSKDGDGKILNTFVKIFNFAKKLGSIFAGFGSGFKSQLGGIIEEFSILGNTIAKFLNSILISKEATKILSALRDVFYNLGSGLGEVVKTIVHNLNTFLSTQLSFKSVAQLIFGTINDLSRIIVEFIEKTFNIDIKKPKFLELVMNFAKKTVPLVQNSVHKMTKSMEGFKEQFANMGSNIKTMFSSLGENTFVEKFVSTMKTMSETTKVFTDNLKNGLGPAIEEIKKYLSDNKIDVGGGTIFAVLNSIISLMATGGIFALVKQFKSIPDTLKDGVKSISKPFKSIADFFDKKLPNTLGKTFNELNKSLVAFQKDLHADILMKIAIAVGILAGSLWLLSSIPYDQLAAGVFAIGGLMMSLTVVSQALSEMSFDKMGKITLLGVALKSFATAIAILAVSIRLISGVPIPNLIASVIAIEVLMTALLGVALGLSLMKGTKKAAAGLISFALAILVLSISVKTLAKLDADQAYTGVMAVVMLLGALALAAKLVSGSKGLMGAGVAMIAMSLAIIIIAEAVSTLGSMPYEQMTQGLNAVIKTMVALGGSLMLISKSKGMFSAAIAIIAISAALHIVVGVLKQMADIPKEATTGFITTLLGLVIALKFMKGSITGALGLVVIAFALKLFIPVLQQMATLNFKSVVKGLITIAAAIATLGAMGFVLGLIGPMFVAAAVGLALFGAGILACGAGIALLVTALVALGSVGKKNVEKLKDILLTLIAIVPEIFIAVAEGVVKFMESLAESTPRIVDSFVKIGLAILSGAMTLLPKVTEFVVAVLESLKIIIPKFIELGFEVFLAFITGIRDNIGRITEVVADIFINFMNALSEKLPEMCQAGVDFIFSMIDAMGVGIRDNSARFYETMKEFGLNVLDGLLQVMDLMKDDVKAIGIGILDKVKEGLSPFTNGVNKMKEIGKNVMEGFIDGIESMIKDAVSEVEKVASKVIGKFKEVLGINSPSKVFRAFGEYTDEGFVSGIKSKSGLVYDSIDELGSNIKDGMGYALNSLSSFDMDDVSSPTIRPVIDLSNVQNGVNSIDNMLYAQRSMSLAGSISMNKVDPYAESDRLREAIELSNGKFANDIIAALGDTPDTNVNVVLAGDASGVFRLVRTENDKFVKSTKYNPLSRSKVK